MKRYPVTINDYHPGIIGKITRKNIRITDRKNYIFISDNLDIPLGYKAVIVKENNNYNSVKKTIIIPLDPECLSELCDGDIISLTGDGYMNIIYYKNSDHNVILATERCNASCIMCPQPKVSDEEDRMGLNLKLISLYDKDTKSITITGGEPTILGDNLLILLNELKRKNINTTVFLLTNGVKLADINYVEKIAKIRHPNFFVDVPLYSDIDSIHNFITGSNGFYKTIKGLYNLALYEQRIGLRVVISKYNYERLYNIAEFIYHNFPFVIHVAFMQMEIMGLAKENIDNLWVDPYDYQFEIEKAVEYLFFRDINVSIYNSTLCLLPKNIWKFTKKSISSWKNIYLDECNGCEVKDQCGGFFDSSIDKKSNYIIPIKKIF